MNSRVREQWIGKIKKLAEKESQIFNLIVEKLYEEMKETCKVCNNDRLTCSFSPMCKNRWFLDIRIEAKIPRSDLPSFCYQRRGKELERFLKKKDCLVKIEDSRYYLDDFLTMVNVKGISKQEKKKKDMIERIINFLRQFWRNVQRGTKNSEVFLFLNAFETLLKINIERNLVIVNPKKEKIDDNTTLSFLLEKWNEILNLQIESFSTPTALYMKVTRNSKLKKLEDLNNGVKKIVPFSQIDKEEGSLIIGISENPSQPNLKYGELQTLMNLLTSSSSK